MIPHPIMATILAEAAAAPLPPPESLPIDVARANFVRANAVWNTPMPPVEAKDLTVGGVACCLLEPAGAREGTILFVHGGGWTFGTPATHARFAALLAGFTRLAVLLPDYRLAPEHPAPAATDDVLAVLAALDAPGPVVLCGDSAGANIALGAALAHPARTPAFLSLLYGCFAPDFGTASHTRNSTGFGLTSDRMRWYWRNWLGPAEDPRAAPGHAELAGLPACHVLAAGLDPLLDDSLLLAGRLAEAGVPVRLDVVPGVVHGFLQMTSRLPPAMAATRTIAAAINAALDDGTREENESWTLPDAAS
jgi:acetyl esterase